jgi:hypothetical protein
LIFKVKSGEKKKAPILGLFLWAIVLDGREERKGWKGREGVPPHTDPPKKPTKPTKPPKYGI